MVSGGARPGTQPGSLTPALNPHFSGAGGPEPASSVLCSHQEQECPASPPLSQLHSGLFPGSLTLASPPWRLPGWGCAKPLGSAWGFCFSHWERQGGEKGKDRRAGHIPKPKQVTSWLSAQFPLLKNGFNNSPLSPGVEGR